MHSYVCSLRMHSYLESAYAFIRVVLDVKLAPPGRRQDLSTPQARLHANQKARCNVSTDDTQIDAAAD